MNPPTLTFNNHLPIFSLKSGIQEENDVIFSITFNSGKTIKNLFNFLSNYSKVTFQICGKGLEIMEQKNKEIKSDKSLKISNICHFIFDTKKQQQFIFQPHLLSDQYTDFLSLTFNCSDIYNIVSSSKTNTSLKFSYYRSNTSIMKIYIYSDSNSESSSSVNIQNISNIREQIDSDIISEEIDFSGEVELKPRRLQTKISDENLQPIVKISSKEFLNFFSKIDKKEYENSDFIIELYSGTGNSDGGYILSSTYKTETKIQSPGGFVGEKFTFVCNAKSIAGFFKEMAKISLYNSTLAFYALNNEMFRVSQYISDIMYQKFYFYQKDKFVVSHPGSRFITHSPSKPIDINKLVHNMKIEFQPPMIQQFKPPQLPMIQQFKPPQLPMIQQFQPPQPPVIQQFQPPVGKINI
jgi:hypothetical protein